VDGCGNAGLSPTQRWLNRCEHTSTTHYLLPLEVIALLLRNFSTGRATSTYRWPVYQHL